MASEQRLRHHFLEQAVEGARDALQNVPEVAERLGGMATELSKIGDQLFIANVRKGELQFPKRYINSEGIPLIAVHRGTKVHVPEYAAKMTPRQEAGLRQRLGTGGDYPPQDMYIRTINDHLAHPTNSDFQLSKGLAQVRAADLQQRNPSRYFAGNNFAPAYRIYGRPLLALLYGENQPVFAASPMLHEYVHLLQAFRHLEPLHDEATPIHTADLNKELEAYMFIGPVADCLQTAGLAADEDENQLRIYKDLVQRRDDSGQMSQLQADYLRFLVQ